MEPKTEMELLLELARANDRAHLAEQRAMDAEVAQVRAEAERDEARRVARVLAVAVYADYPIGEAEKRACETALAYPEAP